MRLVLRREVQTKETFWLIQGFGTRNRMSGNVTTRELRSNPGCRQNRFLGVPLTMALDFSQQFRDDATPMPQWSEPPQEARPK